MSPRLFCGLVVALLAACQSLVVPDDSSKQSDFVAYGASIQAAADDERRVIYLSALSEHDTNPTSASATRLAIASLGVENFLPSREILSLLAFAESSASEDDVRTFIEFFRPFVERLAEQQATIEIETAARQALDAQLEALKELEEQLDATGGAR